MSAEHDLLFGVTALQLRFISQEQLADATADAGSGTSLRDRLCKRGLLTAAEADAVAAVVRERLARFGNDAKQTLDSVGAAEAAVVRAGGAAKRSGAAPPTAPMDSSTYGGPTKSDVALAVTERFATQPPRAWSYSAQHQRFTILRLYQQGGLGRLMIAKDEELNREIALKEILPTYADSEENRRRFVREAEITGALEHPGIVPVYSLGSFPDGRPYYAMRLIRGVDLRLAIEDYHTKPASRAEKQLEFRQLLARFVTVCLAVDYAHHRGVLHRDIKPANIMLGEYGETLVVDWGLAKAMDGLPEPEDFELSLVTPSDRAHSDRTQAGRIVGTVLYMSPEQAAGRIDLLSAASDIYGLGATLYHLVAGRPAFDAGDDDVVFRVQQGRFQPPRAHNRQAPKPLEAICLKAMSRTPERRYASAKELALDVERFLADERVTAYAEPAIARSWRWIKRHRTAVLSLMAAAAVGLVAQAIGVALLKTQRDAAEQNFALAQRAVRDYFVSVSEETLLNQPGMQPLRDRLLRQALDYYDEFLRERQDDPGLRREVAQANFFVGRIAETIDSPEKALPHYGEAAAMQGELLTGAQPDEAAGIKAEYAQTLNAWGRALQNLQRKDAARKRYVQAAALREDLAKAAPDDVEAARALASTVMNLGILELSSGKPEAALPQLERAQNLRLDHVKNGSAVSPELQRDIGMGYFNLAQARLALGDVPAGERELNGAVEAFSKIAKSSPGDLGNRRRLAICQRMLGDAKAGDGDAVAAIAKYEQARDALQELSRENPDVPEYAADLAGVRMNLAYQLDAIGEAEEALKEVEPAIAMLEQLTDRAAAVPEKRCDLGVALRFAGEVLARERREEEARARFEQSKRVLEELDREHPGDERFAAELKLTLDALGESDSI